MIAERICGNCTMTHSPSPAQDDGSSTQGGYNQGHKAPSLSSLQYRVVISPTEGLTAALSYLPRSVLQKLYYKQQKLTGLWPLLTSLIAQRFYVRHGRLRILGPLTLIPAHRVVISCWQRQAKKARGYCSLPSHFS